MFGKLKDKVAAGKEKVAEKRAEHLEKKQNKWSDEVTTESGQFKTFQQWKDLYEPTKEKKEKAEDSGPNAIQRKAMEKLGNNITKNVVKMLMEAISKLLDAAVGALASTEKDLTSFLNAVQGVTMTYRFGYKNKKKFEYIRGVGIDRMAATLLGAVDAAAKAAGKDPKAMDPETVKQIVETLIGKLVAELEGRKQAALDSIKSSPLFAMSGADGAQVDAGVEALVSFLRGYVDDKFAVIIAQAQVVLTKLFNIALEFRGQIEANIAANAGPEEQTEEYKTGVRARLQSEVEGAYGQLETNVRTYIKGLLDLVQGVGGDEEGVED